MSLPLSFLICLSVFNLCLATGPVEEVIKPKEAPLLGSWFDKPPESKDVQKAAQYAVEMYNTFSTKKKLYKMISLTSAQSQITNMIKFKIDTILGKTKCLKTQNLDAKSCDLDKRQIKCQFFVTFNPRLDKYKSYKKTCRRVEQEI